MATDRKVWPGRHDCLERASAGQCECLSAPGTQTGNVMLQKGALVEKVLFQGSRAIGVSYLHNGRQR